MLVQLVRERGWFVGTRLAAALGGQRVQVAQEQHGRAPAPIVALVELTVEQAADGSPVRLRGAVARHGVTTWFVADLTTGQVVLRDARGASWSAGIDIQLLGNVLPAHTGGTPERSVEQRAAGSWRDPGALGCNVQTTVASAELVLRLDDAQLQQQIGAVYLALTWQGQQLAQLVQTWWGKAAV
ncbi:MAG: hypothetical protein ACK42I_10975 [Thermomicrobium sp.]